MERKDFKGNGFTTSILLREGGKEVDDFRLNK